MIRRLLSVLLCYLAVALVTPSQTGPPMQSRFATLDGMRVHYQNYGKGKESLVFVHGWTCNATFWKANVPAFSEVTRVIAIDLPGHGESDKPEKIAYSMELFARAIDAVLQHAKVERATLVGHSMGTPVIRQFYRKYPARTRALVIVDGSLQPFGNPEAMKKMVEPMRGPNYQAAITPMVEGMTRPMKDATLRGEVKTAMLQTPQHVAVAAFDGMLDPAIWQSDKISVPTLAVMAYQPAWTPEYEKFVRDLVPGIEYQVWPGVSHFLMMDEPRQFNGVLMTFLKKNKIVQ